MSRTEDKVDGHERFVELCALATSGTLTMAEERVLNLHLSECLSCRESYAQFARLVKDGIPLLAPDYDQEELSVEWNEGATRQRLLAKVRSADSEAAGAMAWRSILGLGRLRAASLATCLVLIAGVIGYTVGKRQLSSRVQLSGSGPALPIETSPERAAIRSRLSEELKAKGEQLHLAEKQKELAEAKMNELESRVRAAQARIASLVAGDADTAGQLLTVNAERDSLSAQLVQAQRRYQAVEVELNAIQSQYNQSLIRMTSLESDNQALSTRVQEQDRLIADRDQYLSSDRDIRELIGARQLYIADVFDVDQSGKSRGPFGRVFYTRNRSLIFYAFDLDQQPHVKDASAFQVWGERDFGHAKPLNLGILYMDNATDRRWALRFDDPAKLADIDAVFVTVEPNGRSNKPTGKPLLYASLRKLPNHP